jgi:hypothetical protein
MLSERRPPAARKTANQRQREASFRHGARARFLQHNRRMRRLAQALIVTGLLIALAGETLVILDREAAVHHELASGPRGRLGLAPFPLSIWPAVGIGTAISALGVVILMLRPLRGRLRRRLLSSGRLRRDASGPANVRH